MHGMALGAIRNMGQFITEVKNLMEEQRVKSHDVCIPEWISGVNPIQLLKAPFNGIVYSFSNLNACVH